MHFDQVKWGIIGCGDVTEKKSGPAFNKVPNSKLVAVMRRDALKAEDYARRHGVPKWYSNADDLINDQEINAIYVATPPEAHAEYAIKAMKAGKPVYVEKPMAASYEDCILMNKVAAETFVPLFVAYYRRSLPYFNEIKNILIAQSIGQILSVTIELISSPRPADLEPQNLPWRVQPQIAGGGYFYDMACHQLDIIDYLLGPLTEVKGMFQNIAGLYEAEDTVSVSFKIRDKIPGTGLWCFVAAESAHSDRMVITGTKGRIVFSAFDFTPITLETSGGKQEILASNPENIQYCMIEEVVKELRGAGISPSNGISATRTNYVMDLILNKIKQA